VNLKRFSFNVVFKYFSKFSPKRSFLTGYYLQDKVLYSGLKFAMLLCLQMGGKWPECCGASCPACYCRTSDTADKEVEGTEKEEELGIFQMLKRLEEVTNMLTSR